MLKGLDSIKSGVVISSRLNLHFIRGIHFSSFNDFDIWFLEKKKEKKNHFISYK